MLPLASPQDWDSDFDILSKQSQLSELFPSKQVIKLITDLQWNLYNSAESFLFEKVFKTMTT